MKRNVSLLICLIMTASMPVGAKSAPESATLLRHTVHHLFIQGHPLGEIVRRDEKTAQGHYRHLFSMNMKLIRGAQTIHISSELETRADAQHQLQSYRLTKTEGDLLIRSEGKVLDQKLHIQTLRSGNKTEERVEFPEGTMSALSYDLYLWLNRESIQEYETHIFHEDLGTFAHQSSKIIRSEKELIIEHQALGMQTHETYDLQGKLISAHTLEIDLWALVPGNPPPKPDEASLDIMEISTWKTQKIPKKLDAVVYDIKVPGTLQFSPIQDSNQQLRSNHDHLYTIEVKRFKPGSFIISGIEREKLTRVTALEPHNHPDIRKISEQLTKGLKSDEKIVRAISEFVYRHIENKTLDRGAASALETLKAKKGDCTEHSILASALLRSLGYPTRLVDGVIASDRQLGYHEWIEVYIEGQGFVPVDPTFNEFPAGPNRLKFAIGDSSPEGMIQLGITATQLLSGIEVSIKSYTKAK